MQRKQYAREGRKISAVLTESIHTDYPSPSRSTSNARPPFFTLEQYYLSAYTMHTPNFTKNIIKDRWERSWIANMNETQLDKISQ